MATHDTRYVIIGASAAGMAAAQAICELNPKGSIHAVFRRTGSAILQAVDSLSDQRKEGSG